MAATASRIVDMLFPSSASSATYAASTSGWAGRLEKNFLLAPGPEFPELALVVLACVFRLGALESVRHPSALFVGQNGRCIFRCRLLCLEGHFEHYLIAV